VAPKTSAEASHYRVIRANRQLRGHVGVPAPYVQSFGNLAASAIAGLLWTLTSPQVAFGYLVGWMLLALIGLLAARRSSI